MSPVIGVILMVAITVVLATVIVLFVNPTDEMDEVPSLAFRRDEAKDQISLVRGANGNWGDLRLFSPGDGTGLRHALNAQATSASAEVGTGVVLPVADLAAGDYVSFCVDGGGEDRRVTLVHTGTNTMVYEGQFRTVAACA